MKKTRFDLTLLELFFRSSYFTEENILSKMPAILEITGVSESVFLSNLKRKLSEPNGPSWGKPENMSTNLKLFLEISEMNNSEPEGIIDGNFYKNKLVIPKEVEEELYD